MNKLIVKRVFVWHNDFSLKAHCMGSLMKKLISVFFLGFFLNGAYAADSLPVVKKRIAAKMSACMKDKSTGGNSWVDTCRFDAAESFEKAAWDYAYHGLASELKEENEEIEVIQENYADDMAWFKVALDSCSSFKASIKPAAWQDSYNASCRLYWARQAAEYFYRPSEKESQAEFNRSWNKMVDDWVQKEIF